MEQIPHIISDEQLKSISELANRQIGLESEIATRELELDLKKNALKKIQEQDLPDLMASVGMSEFKLLNGNKITISKFYSPNIPADKLGEAFAWLRRTGNDSIIKNELVIPFGKGQDEVAKKAFAELSKLGYSVAQKQGVHHQTLKAFVKEQIEIGDGKFPKDLFGVYEGNKAKITSPK